MYTLNEVDSFQVTPNNTYVYDIVSIPGGLAAISSDDSLRLFNPLVLANGPLSTIKNVNKDVTCLRAVGEGDGMVVVTAGRDGRVKLVDLRSGGAVGEARTDQNTPILSLACSGTNGLAAGTELTDSNYQVSVLIWDNRNLGAPINKYVESHSDDVTELQFHPTRPQILLSGSTDGLVNIFNTTTTDEEEALHQTINHGSSIHHANFLSELDIFALSHDEKFSMYKLVTNPEEGVEEPAPVHFGDLRSDKKDGEYVANVLSRPGGDAVLGIGDHNRGTFELVSFKNSPPWTFSTESKVTLHTAHGMEIVRSFCFLDLHSTVLTCGEDGQIKAWK